MKFKPLDVQITSGQHGNRTKILLDGLDVSRYCNRFELKASAHTATELTLTFIAPIVRYDGKLMREMTRFGDTSRTYQGMRAVGA